MSVLVEACVDRTTGWVELRFPYDPRTVARLKEVPGSRWDPDQRLWRVSLHAWDGVFKREFPHRVKSDVWRDVRVPERFKSRLRPYQYENVQWHLAYGGFLSTLDMRLGKGSPKATPVLTPGGWRPIGSLAVGDLVIDPSTGGSVRVRSVFPRGRQRVYRVTLCDGASVDVDGEHQWAVHTPNTRHRDQAPKIMSTEELIAAGLRDAGHSAELNHGSGNRKFFVPLTEPVYFQESLSPRPIPPWLLGALLADGSLPVHDTLRISKLDQAFLDRASREAAELGAELVPKSRADHGADHRFNKADVLRRGLSLLGLLGSHSVTKFVPAAYLTAPPADRLELLRGLMDGDGDCAVGPTGSVTASYNTTSGQLKDDVLCLVQSLGGFASVSRREVNRYPYLGETRLGLPSWRLTIRMPVNPFSVPAKADRWSVGNLARGIESIEHIGDEETVCIAVDSKDSLYVTKDFIVTHNTPVACAAIVSMFEAGLIDVALILYPNSAFEWPVQVRQWADKKLVKLAGHAPWTAGDLNALRAQPQLIIGCHYEILPERERDLHKLLTGRRFVLVADEAQFLKNADTGRTKSAMRLGRAKGSANFGTEKHPDLTTSGFCQARWGLTGTPMRNRPRDLWALFDFISPDSMGGYWKFAKRYCDAHRADFDGNRLADDDDFGHWNDDGSSNEEELAARLKAISFRKTRAEVAQFLPKSDRKVIFCSMLAEDFKRYRTAERKLGPIALKALEGSELSSTAREAIETLGQFTAKAKIQAAIDRAAVHLARGVKVICFAHFHDPLQRLEQALRDLVARNQATEPTVARNQASDSQSTLPSDAESIDGTSMVDSANLKFFVAGGWLLPEKRRKVISEWKAHPGPALLLANTLSSGIGIDLADAEVAIFLQLTWVPADFIQAEARLQDVHLGKRVLPPIYEYLIVNNTIDAAMATALLRKISVGEAVVGADVESAGVSEALKSAGVASDADVGLIGAARADPDIVRSVLQSLCDRLFTKDGPIADERDALAAEIEQSWDDQGGAAT